MTVGAADGSPELGDVRSGVLKGFAWGTATFAVTQTFRVVIAIVLARLVTPEEYGVAGITLIFGSLVLSLSDFSMGSALIQREVVTEADRSTVFWTSAGIGTVFMLIGFAVAGPLATFYHDSEVRPLFMFVSVSFLLVSLQTTATSVMQREMQFRQINMRITAGIFVGGIIGVVAAFLGAGAWAIVLRQVAGTFVSTVMIWVFSTWRPRFMYSRRSLRELGGFGFNLVGSNLLGYLNRNADNMLIGRFLGSAALGAYSVAYNLMILPLDRLMVPIQETLFPAFSRWQDDLARFASVWLRVVRVIGAIVLPAMVGLAIVTPDFVPVVLGKKWDAAIPVLQILCFVACIQSIAGLGFRVLSAMNRTRTILHFAIVECCATLAAFAVGLHWGIVGVATCYLIVTVPLQSAFVVITARTLKSKAWRVLQSLRGVMLATAVMAVACLATRGLLLHAGTSPFLRLVIVTAVGFVVYLPTCRLAQPQLVDELRKLRPGRSSPAKVDPNAS